VEFSRQVSPGGLHVEAGLVEPWVGLELLHGVAVLAVVREELEDHILEVVGQPGAIDLLEVGLNLTGQEQVVEVFFFAGLFEWEDALYDNEDNDADGE